MRAYLRFYVHIHVIYSRASQTVGRNPKWLRNKLAFCALCRETLRIPGVPQNFLEKLVYVQPAVIIEHLIDKSEDLGTKIDKSELDSE